MTVTGQEQPPHSCHNSGFMMSSVPEGFMPRIASILQSRRLTTAALLVALITLSGCMVIPFHEVYEGSEIKPESLNWMHPGETTRAQVLGNLGDPDIDFVDQNTIAYMWSGSFGGMLIGLGASGGVVPIQMRQALMIQFDLGNKVATFSIINRPTNVVPYDVLDESSAAHFQEWRVILDRWLAEGRDNPGQSGEMPK